MNIALFGIIALMELMGFVVTIAMRIGPLGVTEIIIISIMLLVIVAVPVLTIALIVYIVKKLDK